MPWLTPVVFKQTAETLTELPRFGDGPKAVRFRHIVHAYKDKAVPANTAIQSITLIPFGALVSFASLTIR